MKDTLFYVCALQRILFLCVVIVCGQLREQISAEYEDVITLRRRGQSEVFSLGVPDSGLIVYSVSTMVVIVLLLDNTLIYYSTLFIILSQFRLIDPPIKEHPYKY